MRQGLSELAHEYAANSTNTNSTVAGYGVYNSSSGDLANIVLFNFADQGSDEAKFAVPAMDTPAIRSDLILSAPVLGS